MLSPQIEEYLESIFKLQDKISPLRVSELSEDLKVSAAAVTDMLKKLKARHLVSDDTSSGIMLTAEGESEAKTIIRKHRLTERFLTDVLGMPWDIVHEEACKLEHAMGPEVINRLEEFMNKPKTCPHGHPVPDARGRMDKVPSSQLSMLKNGESGEIVSVSEDDPQMLQYLASLGLIPGATIDVIDVAPFNGPLLVNIITPNTTTGGKKQQQRGCRYALGREVAAKIFVGGRPDVKH